MKIGPRHLVSDAVYSIFVAKEPFVYRAVPNTTNGVLEAGASNPLQSVYTLLTVSGLTDLMP